MKKFIFGLLIPCIAVSGDSDTNGFFQDIGVGPSYMDEELAPYCPAAYRVMDNTEYSFEGGFLYWRVSQGGSELYTAGAGTNTSTLSTAYRPHKYNPGFRLTGSMDLNHDDWMFNIWYTRVLAASEKDSGSLTAGSVRPFEGLTLETVTSSNIIGITMTERIAFDRLDFRLSRPFYSGQELAINYEAGLGYVSLKEVFRYNVDRGTIPTPSIRTTFFRSSSSLVGPSFCVGARWILPCGFQLFQSFGGAVFYQKQNTKVLYDITGDTVDLTSQHYFVNVSPAVRGSLGVDFHTAAIFSFEWELYVRCAYEFQHYWYQNAARALGLLLSRGPNKKAAVGDTRRSVTTSNALSENNPGIIGDLTYQGFNVSIGFNF